MSRQLKALVLGEPTSSGRYYIFNRWGESNKGRKFCETTQDSPLTWRKDLGNAVRYVVELSARYNLPVIYEGSKRKTA